MIFPEGTRSASGQLGEFKDGAFRLAIETQLPILPLAVQGTRTRAAQARLAPRRGRTPTCTCSIRSRPAASPARRPRAARAGPRRDRRHARRGERPAGAPRLTRCGVGRAASRWRPPRRTGRWPAPAGRSPRRAGGRRRPGRGRRRGSPACRPTATCGRPAGEVVRGRLDPVPAVDEHERRRASVQCAGHVGRPTDDGDDVVLEPGVVDRAPEERQRVHLADAGDRRPSGRATPTRPGSPPTRGGGRRRTPRCRRRGRRRRARSSTDRSTSRSRRTVRRARPAPPRAPRRAARRPRPPA